MGKLTSTLPAQLVKPNSKLLQKEIQDALADPAYNLPAPVDVILGADVFLAILQPGQVKDEFENPVSQNTIFGWIFRSNEIALFRQVWVHPQDRDFQRVVWRSDPGEPIKHFRLCSVTYGMKPAPYLAIEAIREAARNYDTMYPKAAQRIVLDMYVDDFMSGAKNIDEWRPGHYSTVTSVSLWMKLQVCEILRSAGFNLRKWTTNRPELLSDNEYTEQMPVDMKLAEQPEAVKALGIQWLPKDDVFSFKVSLSVDSVNTKRQLLSDSSRLFDPYGWLSPVMLKIKILFQQLWLSDVSWDNHLPASVEVPLKDIKEGLYLLEQIRIPRYMVSFGGKVQLHGFSDASEMAYGAVIYSRARDDADNIFVNLVAAKTRVAPIKQVSLPRLELSAAALMAELMQRVTQALSHLTCCQNFCVQ
nr:uncharacterized protein LOC109416182 [Aedes albopictus]XP_029719418.1 uncharacterized protein LOC115261655 [Aedes albopictus]